MTACLSRVWGRTIELLAVVMFLHLTGAAQPVAAQDSEHETAELDVLILTNLHTTPAHEQKYREQIRKGIEQVFKSLNPRFYSDTDRPLDGAARFRLIVEHRGRVFVGGQLMPELSPGPAGSDQVSWQIPAGQIGEILIRLLHWNVNSYEPVTEWPVPLAKDRAPQRVEVASVRIPRGAPPPEFPPLPIEQARLKALDTLMPPDIQKAILAELVDVDLAGAEAIPDGTDRPRGKADVVVFNYSPWPIREIQTSVEWRMGMRGFKLILEQKFDPPVMPGKDAAFTGTGWTAEVDASSVSRPQVSSISFARSEQFSKASLGQKTRKPSKQTEAKKKPAR